MASDNLLLQERHALILQRLVSDGRVLAPNLAQQLNVSEDTIRRDLRDLAAAGLCQKVYGGALRLPSAPDTGTLAQRTTQQAGDKSRLAQTAATLVEAGNILFIDAGSTNLAIAAALPPVPLTVITNAPAIAMALTQRLQIELIMIGGRIDPHVGATLGGAALRDIDLIRPDLFFLGACGVDAQAGVSAIHFEEAEFKRRVAAISKAVAIAATDDKLGTAAPYLVLPTGQLTYLVIESSAEVAQITPFSAIGVQVLRAETLQAKNRHAKS
ncbi:MAG: DeoR/GlpR family DNA-binding transcription regulator [Pseudomonadota bacterium]